ncbi:MAG: hypothetical protein JWM86_1665 [Thermoleophilia bacterium]|nr:hypothetical protein [Thermoleophilia bacterium]
MIVDYMLARLHHGEEGQTMAEYAVVLAVITAAIVAALIVLSDGIRDKLTEVTGAI